MKCEECGSLDYDDHGEFAERLWALRLFDELVRNGSDDVRPNWVTVTSILPACAQSAALEQGQRIHCYASEMGLDRHMAVQIALLTMYAKSGSLDDARRCFDRIHMDDKDVVAWNAMITAYTSHGQGIKAVATFEEMIQSGVQPDAIIFTSLLSGCSRAGLVDRGMKYFEAMTTIHNPREICAFLENLPVKIKVAG